MTIIVWKMGNYPKLRQNDKQIKQINSLASRIIIILVQVMEVYQAKKYMNNV